MTTNVTKPASDHNMILDGHKLFCHKDRLDAWLNGERIAPITVDIALTRSCTYQCYFCYAKLQKNDEKRMTEDVIYRFFDDAAEIGVKAVSFVSDGESTVNKNLYNAILRGKSNGLDIALGTNGYLLDDERLEEILPCLTYLRFNFSAGEAQRYAEIMGCEVSNYHKVVTTIRKCVAIKRRKNLDVTLGLQMVLISQDIDQVIPLAELGKEVGVDYTVIKHCSDDENGSLGVDYNAYFQENVINSLKEAEAMTDRDYLVKAKWSKILSGGKRSYNKCYGTPFIFQISGSGLMAPCGKLFNEKYQKHHIGNIVDKSFKEIWKSDAYWKKHNFLHSLEYDPQTMCGNLCLQDKVNEIIFKIKEENYKIPDISGPPPMHVNFI